jgi:hypothetical protein
VTQVRLPFLYGVGVLLPTLPLKRVVIFYSCQVQWYDPLACDRGRRHYSSECGVTKNDNVGRIWNGAAVAYLKILYQRLRGETEERHEKPPPGYRIDKRGCIEKFPD